MNLFDIFLIVIVVFCLVRGIFRGLVKELAAIVGVLAGFYAGYTYCPELARLLGRWIDNPSNRDLLAFFLLFGFVLTAVSVLGVVIRYLMRIAFLGWLDRTLGAFFGLVKALLISAVLLLALTAFLPRDATVVRDSLLAPHLARLSDTLVLVVSGSMEKGYEEGRRQLDKYWRKVKS